MLKSTYHGGGSLTKIPSSCVEGDVGKILPPTPKNNMTPQTHLEKRLKDSTNYLLSTEDKKIIQFEGINTYIYRKVTSGKFRKTSIDPDSQIRVKEAIKLNVENNAPIKFTYPFGGYKTWRVPSYPAVDWAEFMTISYVLRFIAPVSTAYSPGVEIYFSSDDVVIELIDNYPRKALDAYVNSFNKLLGNFKNYLPTNVKLVLKQVVPDYYDKDTYTAELESIAKEMRTAGMTEERKAKLAKAFEFNFLRNGKKDLTDEEKYQQQLEELMIYSDAYLKLKKRADFVRGIDKIVLFSNKISNAIDIGSTNVSKAKFWAGIGVLEKDKHYYDRILAPTQWETVKNRATFEKVDLIPMKNFEEIAVFSERFNFLKTQP